MFVPILVALAILGQPRLVDGSASPGGILDVFQVYQPVNYQPGSVNNCDLNVLLMYHVFAESYGQPFVGDYVPPSCSFDTVRINMTVTSSGRQYDRLALMYLGDAEVFRTSTAEPTSTGIAWTYIKEMSQYNALWQAPQKLLFDLGNIINDVYTGPFNVRLTAHFSKTEKAPSADIILPISARRSAANSASAFTVPSDNTTVTYGIPNTVKQAVVAISACGQSQEEFWWSNVFTEDTHDFDSTVGELYGYSPFREIQLYIDGILAGVVWPFPIIFTGGVAPGFWRPIVGIDAFDLRQSEIDISPFLPMLQDGRQHSFEIRVAGVAITAGGTAVLTQSVGSYWVVTGNIFLFNGQQARSQSKDKSRGSVPHVVTPAPIFSVKRHLAQNKTGGNDTLSYSVTAERTLTVSSPDYTWSQRLSFSNFGYLNQQGYSQVNDQKTSGVNRITKLGHGHQVNSTSFDYPLLVNATYGITPNSLSIDAWMTRGLDIKSSGEPGISTYTFVSGPSELHTSQSGSAHYKSVTGSGSFSYGSTSDEFSSISAGVAYSRRVEAVNGTVVSDSEPGSVRSAAPGGIQKGLGRGNIRSMLGRGPGNPPS